MTKLREKIEEVNENIAYAESGEYNPHHKKVEETDSLEDILTAIAMAEGGEEEQRERANSRLQDAHLRVLTGW